MPATPAPHPGSSSPPAASGLLPALAGLSLTLPRPGSDAEAAALADTLDALACGLASAATGLRANPRAAATVPEDLTLAERLGRVDALDLEPVVCKLTSPEPGALGLTLAEADQDVALYRCFLKLCLMHPGQTLVPSRRVDRVWHTHLLDTAQYRADCDQVFGHFMDHFPYFGMGGNADQATWRRDFNRTRRLFQEHFRVEVGAESAASACGNHGDGSDCCTGPAAAPRPRPDRTGPPAAPGHDDPNEDQGSEAAS